MYLEVAQRRKESTILIFIEFKRIVIFLYPDFGSLDLFL
jgi:hypothetical protein